MQKYIYLKVTDFDGEIILLRLTHVCINRLLRILNILTSLLHSLTIKLSIKEDLYGITGSLQ
jgi:hypothetical protein